MFNKLYIGEMKKLLRPKTLIALAIIMVVFLFVYAVSYNFMVNIQSDMSTNVVVTEAADEGFEGILDEMMFGGAYGKRVYTEEEMPMLLEGARLRLAMTKEAREGNSSFLRFNMDSVYEAKGYLKALEYIQDHEIYDTNVEIYSNMAIFNNKSAEGFMKGFFSLLIAIMAIYGIVVGAGSFAGEMKNGTLKMLFMRPITRTKLTTAKLLALISMVTGLIAIGVVLSYLYGLIRFGAAPAQKSIFVFNAMSAFMGTNRLGLFLNILFGTLQVLAFSIFAFALGTITRNRNLALIAGIILQSGLLSIILSLLKVGRFLFTTSSNIGIYFGVTAGIPASGNFFIALPMFLAYLALFIGSTYWIFNKRDIA